MGERTHFDIVYQKHEMAENGGQQNLRKRKGFFLRKFAGEKSQTKLSSESKSQRYHGSHFAHEFHCLWPEWVKQKRKNLKERASRIWVKMGQ